MMKRFLLVFTMLLGFTFAGSVSAQDRGYWIEYRSPSTGERMECWTPSRESDECLYSRRVGASTQDRYTERVVTRTVVKEVDPPARTYTRVYTRPSQRTSSCCNESSRYRDNSRYRDQDRRYREAEQRRYQREPLYQRERRSYDNTEYEIYPRYGTWVPGVRIRHTRGNDRYELESNDRDGRLRGRINMDNNHYNYDSYRYQYRYYYPW